MLGRARVASLAVVVLATVACQASADVALGSLFSDHMVLQRDATPPIWGAANANDKVTISIDGKEVATGTAGADGTFKVKLPKQEAGGPHTVIVSAGDDSTTLSDVLFGDVWIASGQSNMQWSLWDANDGPKEAAAANDDQLRFYYVPRVGSATPVKNVKAEWTPCTPDTAKGFSAVAYFFGRALRHDLNIPIGLLHTSWGGTPAEAWTPIEKLRELKDLPELQRIVARHDAAEKNEPPVPPATQPMQLNHPNAPASLYNGMVAPLADFGVKGIIWYQGESNAARHAEYRKLLGTMITSWREQLGQGDVPFYIVGLANFIPTSLATAPTSAPGEPPATWAHIREAQRLVAHDLKNAATTVTIDIGDPANIHPKNKQEVGRRLALVALADTYGKTLVSRGPTLGEADFGSAEVTIAFDNVGGGLKSIHEPLESFQVAGEDDKWFDADATISDDGHNVVVKSKDVPNPTQVRYAWADNPKATLFNAEGLPAEPFQAKKGGQ